MALTEKLQFLITANADNAIKAFQATGKAADKDLGNAEKKLDKVGGTLTKVGAGAVAFAGVAGAALWKVGSAAGDQNAAISAMEQVLGDASDAVLKWSDDSVKAVGLSKTAAVEAATQFGGIAKAAEMTGPQVANFAIEMTGLASDMAAFKNVKPEEALQDLQSGFAGSTEVLRKYNIYLDDSSLKAAYFRETGEKVSGTLTAQQRIIATHSEIMRQSADIQGQWNRELDSNESKTAMFKANLDNLAASIGQGVVPVMSTVLGVLNQTVTAFESLPDPVKKAVGGFAAVGAGVAGLGGAVSLAVGQIIKMRDNLRPLVDRLRTTEGGLTKMGKAAAGAGVALGALAAVEVVGQVFNTVTDSAGRNERSLQQLTVTIGEYAEGQADATTVLDDFQSKVSDVGSTFSLGNVIKNFGKEINLVNAEGESFAYNIETIDKAFQDLLDTSPQQAQLLVQALRDQAAAMGENAYEFDGYIQLADRYQERIDLQVGSTEALTAATEGNTAATQGNTQAQGEGASAAADHTQHLAWLYDQMEEGVRAANEAAAAERELSLAEKEAAQQAAAHRYQHDLLMGSLSKEEAWISIQQQFNTLEEDAAAAFDAASTGAADADGKMLTYQASLVTTKQRVAEYATEILGLPASVVSEIVANLDPASGVTLDETLAALENLRLGATVSIYWSERNKPPVIRPGGGGYAATGKPVDPYSATVVNERRPELLRTPHGDMLLMGSEGGQVIGNPDVKSSGSTVNNFFPGAVINQMVDVDAAVQRINLLLAS